MAKQESTKKSKKTTKTSKTETSTKSKGLGDTIEKITTATGIKAAVKAVVGEDCGCDDRQIQLNKLFSYKKINCISEDDYTYLSDFINSNPRKVTHNQKLRLIKIHNSVFNTNRRKTSCDPCMIEIVNKLKKYLQVYK